MQKSSPKNKYDLPLAGAPDLTVRETADPDVICVHPKTIDLIKPKMLVKKGDAVQIGTPLFLDKQQPDVVFASPAGGVVDEIVLGHRRVIESVTIKRDKDEKRVSFEKVAESDIGNLTREQIIERLKAGGLWQTLRTLPFNTIADASDNPERLIVSLDKTEPFMPNSDVIFDGQDGWVRHGLAILEKLCDHVQVCIHKDSAKLMHSLADKVTVVADGPYPSTVPSVVLYQTKTSADQNKAWSIVGQDVTRIAKLLITGEYPIERTVVVAGDRAANPMHIKTREGSPIQHIVDVIEDDVRIIAGGVFTGRKAQREGGLNYGEDAIHLITEGREPEMLHFFKPGFDKLSYFRGFMASLLPAKKWGLNTSINGGYRSCISCSACPNVCPVDLYPQLIVKELHAGDIESAMGMGLLDCVECGLCSVVCPSKIEVAETLKEAKHRLVKEL